MKFLWILMVILIGICLCVSGQAAETTASSGTVSGIVTDLRSAVPVFGANVEVMEGDTSLGLSARTDRDGKYAIESVPAGIFDLTVSRKGYIPTVISNVTVRAGEATPGTNIAIELATPIQVGEEERNFTLTAVGGKTVSLEDFKEKSVVVLCIGNPYT
jgi:hypothetical protein